jgi:hypothetical protein
VLRIKFQEEFGLGFGLNLTNENLPRGIKFQVRNPVLRKDMFSERL